MSKTMQNILKIQEQTGIDLIQQQKEVDYYQDRELTSEEIEKTLRDDPGYQKFLDELDEGVPF